MVCLAVWEIQQVFFVLFNCSFCVNVEKSSSIAQNAIISGLFCLDCVMHRALQYVFIACRLSKQIIEIVTVVSGKNLTFFFEWDMGWG